MRITETMRITEIDKLNLEDVDILIVKLDTKNTKYVEMVKNTLDDLLSHIRILVIDRNTEIFIGKQV